MKKTFGKHIALLAVLLGTAAAAQADNKQLEQQVLGATPQKRQADTVAAAGGQKSKRAKPKPPSAKIVHCRHVRTHNACIDAVLVFGYP